MASELLDVYGLSKARGFLPEQPPQDSFSDSYYSPWDKLVAHLPQLIASHTICQAVEKLPLLTTKNLTSQSDFERGYVVLSFIAHALVWGSRQDGKGVEIIPPQITEPYFDICDKLGMQRVLSYAGLCLWNWRPMPEATKGENGFYDLANLRSVASFMNSRGEDAFYHVPVLVEAEGGPLVHKLLHALEQAEAGNITAITEALNLTTKTLERMITHLPKLYASLDANMFYFKLRPYLAGGKGMEEKGLKRGFVFQRSNGSEVESRLIGGSAAQSSLFQFLDLALGVEHQGPRDGSESVFTEMRRYMPGKHREFLAAVSERPSLRVFAEAHQSDSSLSTAFDESLKQLRKWRATHIAVVSKYIVRPARQGQSSGTAIAAEKPAELETAQGEELQGTGGSALVPFLRQSKEETVGLRS